MPGKKLLRTLVVEDDAEMRRFYAGFFKKFRADGYLPTYKASAEEALEILRREPVDIILLDWVLPGISGEDLLRAVRADEKTRAVGVLMVTGKCSPREEIQALDSGADDHLAKPFDEQVLLARLRSLRRRRERALSELQADRYPGLVFSEGKNLLRIDRKRIHLTPKEQSLLGIFLQRPNTLHTHSFLWECLWGYEADNWKQVVVYTTAALRLKLGYKWGRRIRSHRTEGYIFDHPH